MASYKKKTSRSVNIEMTRSKKARTKNIKTRTRPEKLTVLVGGKSKRKTVFSLIVAVAVVLFIAYTIVTIIHPIGLTEYLSSSYKITGNGKGYPIDMGSEDIITTEKTGSYFYVLNQSDLHCYNLSGKTVSKIHHGLAKPVLSISETRSLIYGQGEKLLKIYNFDDEILNLQFEKEILCADIADNGNFAVATYADSYDSVVKVFNKKNETVYEWYSATGIVNDVTLINDGKKLLVSTFTADNGVINSKLHLLNFKSADDENTYNFDGDIPYDIIPLSKNRFYVLFEKSLKLIDLNSGTKDIKSTDYTNKHVDIDSQKLLLLSKLEASDDKNFVELFDKRAKAFLNSALILMFQILR